MNLSNANKSIKERNAGIQFREIQNFIKSFFEGSLFKAWLVLLLSVFVVITIFLKMEKDIRDSAYSQRFVFAVPVDSVQIWNEENESIIDTLRGFEVRLINVSEDFKGSKGYLIPNPKYNNSNSIRVTDVKQGTFEIPIQNIIKLEYKHTVAEDTSLWTIQHLDSRYPKKITRPYIIGDSLFYICESREGSTETLKKAKIKNLKKNQFNGGEDVHLYTISQNGIEITRSDIGIYAWLLDYDGTLYRHEFKSGDVESTDGTPISQIELEEVKWDTSSFIDYKFIRTGWQSLDIVHCAGNDSIKFLAVNAKQYLLIFFTLENPYGKTSKINFDFKKSIPSVNQKNNNHQNPHLFGPKRWDEGAATESQYLFTTDALYGHLNIWEFANPDNIKYVDTWIAEDDTFLPAYLEGVAINKNKHLFLFDRNGLLRYTKNVDLISLKNKIGQSHFGVKQNDWLKKRLDHVEHGQDLAFDPETDDLWIATEYFIQRLSKDLFTWKYRNINQFIKEPIGLIRSFWVFLIVLTVIAKVYNITIKKERIHSTRLKAYTTRLERIKILNFEGIVGESLEIHKVKDDAVKAAASDATVLITGESGTGKKLVAKIIHKYSDRSPHPFITVSCGAIAPTLIESELFGHVKGAFTGAIKDKKGKFELADGGTIFLDEINSLGLDLQVKLLRVLEDKEFEQVGGEKTIKVDVRIIAATNEEIEDLIKASKFRKDLFYRLNVIPIKIRPLRERKEDIPMLAQHFLERLNKEERQKGKKIVDKQLFKAELEFLINQDWPGNVRELENFIKQKFEKNKSNEDDNRLYILGNNHVEYKLEEEDSRIQVSLNFELFREKFKRLPTWDELNYEYLKRLYGVFHNWEKISKILDVIRKTLDDRRKKLEGKLGKI